MRDETSKRKRRLVGGGLLLLCVGGVLAWRTRPASVVAEPATGLAGSSSPTPAPAPERTARADQTPSPQDEGAAPSDEDAPPDPKELMGWRREELFRRRPDLREYRRLTEKALLTAYEQSQLQAMLSDPRRIQKAQRDLADLDANEHFKESSLRRQYAVDFLSEAAGWADNPKRGEAVDAAVAALEEPVPKDAPLEMRRSAAGDRVELYAAVRTYAADRVPGLKARAPELGNGALLAFAELTYERRLRTRKGTP